MSNIYDLVKRYPWLPSIEKYYSDISSKDPVDFIKEISQSESYNEIKVRILNIFNIAFTNLELITNYKPDELNIYVYIFLRIILYVLDNKSISNRVANLYAKTINKELNEDKDYNLYEIYKDIGLDVQYEKDSIIYKKRIVKDQQELFRTNYKIYFIDYLKLASNLRDDYRKLVNNALLDGYVYIRLEGLNRLLQEHVRMKLLNISNKDFDIIKKFKEELLDIKEFKNIYDTISTIWESKKEEFEYNIDITYSEGKNISEIFPPCIKEILSKAQEGQNLIHTERLFILWFLNALKFPEDEIINVFSTLPDFDREKTAYQVKFAMKKGYTPYSCKSLKSYTLCMAKQYKDDLCVNGYFSKKLQKHRYLSHPLFYVQFKQFVNSIKSKPEESDLNKKK